MQRKKNFGAVFGPTMLAMFMLFMLALQGLHTAPAWAGELEKAQEHYADGVKAFEAEQYEDALAQFKEAYNLSEKPEILYNLAICHEKLNQLDHAVAYYELYVEEMPDAKDAEFVRQKAAWLNDPENNPPPIEKKAAAKEKPEAPPEPKKKPQVTPEKPAEADQPLTVIIPPDPNARKKKIAQGMLIGMGSLVFATGGLTAIAAYKNYNGYENTCAPDCTDDQLQKVRRLSIAADIQMGLGLAALATGVFWMIFDKKKERLSGKDSAAWQMNPFVSPMGSGVGIGRSF